MLLVAADIMCNMLIWWTCFTDECFLPENHFPCCAHRCVDKTLCIKSNVFRIFLNSHCQLIKLNSVPVDFSAKIISVKNGQAATWVFKNRQIV